MSGIDWNPNTALKRTPVMPAAKEAAEAHPPP